jgi:uncharacterized protein (TIGR03000 family)
LAEIQKLRESIDQLRKQLEDLKGKGKDEVKPKDKELVKVSQPAPAQVTIKLPADARLYIDNVACPLTSGTRSFTTPTLAANKKYFYSVRAEVIRDGETLTETQQVIVEAGQQVTATFSKFAPVTTSVQR